MSTFYRIYVRKHMHVYFLTGQTNSSYTENSRYIIKLVYSFLCLDEEGTPEDRFNERVRLGMQSSMPAKSCSIFLRFF